MLPFLLYAHCHFCCIWRYWLQGYAPANFYYWKSKFCPSKSKVSPDTGETELLEAFAPVRFSVPQSADFGSFGIILPTFQQKHFAAIATRFGLFVRRETMLYTLPGRPPKRILMELTKKEEPLLSDSLTIYDAENSYSEDYKQLTKDFYLAF